MSCNFKVEYFSYFLLFNLMKLTCNFINHPCFDRYMGPMSRDTAAERLKAQPNGTFLVRDSENPARRGFPALSIKYVNCL